MPPPPPSLCAHNTPLFHPAPPHPPPQPLATDTTKDRYPDDPWCWREILPQLLPEKRPTFVSRCLLWEENEREEWKEMERLREAKAEAKATAEAEAKAAIRRAKREQREQRKVCPLRASAPFTAPRRSSALPGCARRALSVHAGARAGL